VISVKKIGILFLLMGLNTTAVASTVSIGSYKELGNGNIELTTDSPAVSKTDVEQFLGLAGLAGYEGSAIKGSLSVAKDQVFSFDWSFTTSWLPKSGAIFDDFSFVSLNLGEQDYFETFTRASDTLSTGAFKWTAVEAGVLSFGIGIMDLGDTSEDSSLVISNINPVPLPAAAWLFISGLVGLVGFRRRVSH